MGPEFDPCWEYRVVPQEIEEAGLFPRAEGFSAIQDQDRERHHAARPPEGFRFGRGESSLNLFRFRLAREKPARESADRAPVSCGTCGGVFTPRSWDRATRRYCSLECASRAMWTRPDSVGCQGCGRAFAPLKPRQTHCSQGCVMRVLIRRSAETRLAATARASADAVAMFDAGVSSNEIARRTGLSPETVRKRLRAAGRVMRPRGTPPKKSLSPPAAPAL